MKNSQIILEKDNLYLIMLYVWAFNLDGKLEIRKLWQQVANSGQLDMKGQSLTNGTESKMMAILKSEPKKRCFPT